MSPRERRESDVVVEMESDAFVDNQSKYLNPLIRRFEEAARSSAKADMVSLGYQADSVQPKHMRLRSRELLVYVKEHASACAAAKDQAGVRRKALNTARTELHDKLHDKLQELEKRLETAEYNLGVAERDRDRAEAKLREIQRHDGEPDQSDQG